MTIELPPPRRLALLAGACLASVLIGLLIGWVLHAAIGGPASGEPYCELPAELEVSTPAFSLEASRASGPVEWFLPDPGLAVIMRPTDRSLVLSASSGTYRVYGYAAKGNRASAPALTKVRVKLPGPGPGPVPPDPGPKPPDPPAPQPVEGNAVLIVYETADLHKMPEAQRQILTGQEMRKYLDQKCGPDKSVSASSGRAWRMWDQNQALDGEAKFWKDAMARPRASVPWIWANGRRVHEGPLPANTGDTINLLKSVIE